MYVDQIKVACDNSQIHIVQCLIEMNLDRMRDDVTAFASRDMVSIARLPMGVMQSLASRGFFDLFSNAAQDFNVFTVRLSINKDNFHSVFFLSLLAFRQEVFEFYLRTCFPFWHTLKPRRKQDILELLSPYSDWTAHAVRLLVCHHGPVQAIDTRTWVDDGASLLHLVLPLYFNSCYRDTTKDWHALLQEIIAATDDLHHILKDSPPIHGIRGARSALKSSLVLTLNNILGYGHSLRDQKFIRHILKQLKANLQSLMSIVASCGHDLLEFGRREAAIWVGQSDTCRIAKEALILYPSDTFRIIHSRWYLWVIHYGPEPLDWYFEWECPKEDYAGEFWALVERPPPTPMPGAWVDED